MSARLHTASLPPPPQHAPASSKQYQTTTNHNSNTSSRNRIPQSTFKTLTRRIAARQPSIRSKPQRMKRDLQTMLHIGETSRPSTRASQCTPKHTLSSPQQQHAPASSNQITNTHTQPQITAATHKQPQPHLSINVHKTHPVHCSTSAFDPIKASTHET